MSNKTVFTDNIIHHNLIFPTDRPIMCSKGDFSMVSSAPWGFILDQALGAATNKGWTDKLVAFFRAKRKILVLGASGVGKTQMMRALKVTIIQAIPGHERTRFTEKTKVIFGNLPFLFYDTPGHIPYELQRRKSIQLAIKEGVEGIFNVVSYGYHEGIGSTLTATDITGHPLKEFLTERRNVEIEHLKEWVNWVDEDFTKWVITVATKADLWWHESKDVSEYYENGLYFNALGSFPKSVTHAVLPYCSIIEQFYGYRNPCIGETQKQKIQQHFLEQLLSASGKIK